jgi:hypothetical protein
MDTATGARILSELNLREPPVASTYFQLGFGGQDRRSVEVSVLALGAVIGPTRSIGHLADHLVAPPLEPGREQQPTCDRATEEQ